MSYQGFRMMMYKSMGMPMSMRSAMLFSVRPSYIRRSA